MYFKRILAGASIVGAMGLTAPWLGAGVAAAEPAAGAEVVEPAPVDPALEEQQREEEQQNAASGSGSSSFELPPELSNEIAKNVGNLPSPVELNVPVGIGLPDIGLPGVGFSVPVVLNPPDLQLPAPPNLGLPAPPSLPQVPNVFNLPAPPRLPF